jgi:hypothetical protein
MTIFQRNIVFYIILMFLIILMRFIEPIGKNDFFKIRPKYYSIFYR